MFVGSVLLENAAHIEGHTKLEVDFPPGTEIGQTIIVFADDGGVSRESVHLGYEQCSAGSAPHTRNKGCIENYNHRYL